MPKKTKSQFPNRIYARIVNENDVPILIADETYDAADDGEEIGVYFLESVEVKRVAHSLEGRAIGRSR